VENTSPVDALTLQQFTDSIYGDVTVPAGRVIASTCVLPQTLAAQGTNSCHFRVRINGAVGTTQTNTLTVTATDDDQLLSAQATATVTVVGPVLRATKQVALLDDRNGDGVASPGETLGYTVAIANVGNGADEVRLFDSVDPNTRVLPATVATSQGIVAAGAITVSADLGALAPSTTATVTFAVVLNNPLPPGLSKVSSQGWVLGQISPALPTDDPSTPAQGDPTETLVVTQPLLLATKRDSVAVDADGDGLPSPGDTLAYTVAIVNSGNQAALGTVFHDTIDSVATLVADSVQSSQGEIGSAGNTVTVAVGEIKAGATVTITFHVLVTKSLPPGVVQTSNQGQVTGLNFNPVPTDDPDTATPGDPTRTLLTAASSIQLTKRDLIFLDANGDNLVSPGDTLLYALQLVNQGNVAATDLRLTDAVDPRSTLVAGTVRTTTGAVQQGNAPGDTAVALQFDTLAPGARIDADFRVMVGAGGQPELSNQAVVRYHDPGATQGEPLMVLSDDPDTAAANDPTITPLQGIVAGGTHVLYLSLVTR
jgi:uncharacterized repeat protein (TIGR01451 family)